MKKSEYLGLMWRIPTAVLYETPEREVQHRQLAGQFFGTEDVVFTESHRLWWVILSLFLPSKAGDLLECWKRKA